MYFVKYTDGDEEDLDEKEIELAVKVYAKNSVSQGSAHSKENKDGSVEEGSHDVIDILSSASSKRSKRKRENKKAGDIRKRAKVSRGSGGGSSVSRKKRSSSKPLSSDDDADDADEDPTVFVGKRVAKDFNGAYSTAMHCFAVFQSNTNLIQLFF